MKKQGVVAFAFGAPETVTSNKWIHCIAARKAKKLNASVYTQRDVLVLSGTITLGDVTCIEEESGNPPSTLRIARGAVRWAKEHGIVELWVVAALPHLSRCLRDMKMAVCEMGGGIVILTCEEIKNYPEDLWFCPFSKQKWTRTRKAWERRERIVRFMPFWIYKLVAS